MALRHSTLFVAIGMAVAGAAAADDEFEEASTARAPVTLDNVVVTAERRESNLQDTPVAVGVIGGEALERSGAGTLRDLRPGTVAGLDIPDGAGPGMGYRAIRGIGTGAPATNAAVALYVDDVFLPRIIGSSFFGLPDVERVEVLRGPQGTLYGQNSSAGAIKVVSLTPDEQTRAWASLGFGNHGAFEAKGLYAGALAPGLLYASFAYVQRENDGTVWNATLGKRVNRIDTRQGRAKFRLTPSEDTEIVLAVDALDDNSDNYATTRTNVAGWRDYVTLENKELLQQNKGGGVSLSIRSRLGEGLEFKSVSAWRQWKIEPDVWSYDGYPSYLFGWHLDLDQHQYSQELQLNGEYGRLSFTAGLIGFVENLALDRPTWTNNVYTGIASETDVKSYGVYGQLHYALTERLGLTAGARFNRQSDEFSWLRYDSDASLQRLAVTSRLDGLRQRTSGTTPKLGLDYRFSEHAFGYASIARGEKAGGYNPVSGALAVAAIPVNPEKVTTYELGFKKTGRSGRFDANVALFYNEFDDYQAGVANPVVNGEVINGSVIVNAAKATLYGAEFETRFKATANLAFNASVTYVKSEFDEFLNPTGAVGSDFQGRPLPVPKWLAGLGVSYRVPLPVPGQLALNANLSHRGEVPQLDAAHTILPERTLLDAGAEYFFPSGNWSLSVGVKNALDKAYPISLTSVPAYGIQAQTLNDPRSWVTTLRKDFY